MKREERLAPKSAPAEIEKAAQILKESPSIQARQKACKKVTAKNKKECNALAELLAAPNALKARTKDIAGFQKAIQDRKPEPPAPRLKPEQLTMGEFGKENIRYHEKFCEMPCPDPGRPGQMNIGYGHGMLTAAERKKYAKGITKEQAEVLLSQDVGKKEKELQGLLNKDVELTQNQWNALAGLYYNLIPGRFDGSKVQTNLNAKNYDAARDEMATFRMGTIIDPRTKQEKQVVMPGLERRRLNEIDLWNAP